MGLGTVKGREVKVYYEGTKEQLSKLNPNVWLSCTKIQYSDTNGLIAPWWMS